VKYELRALDSRIVCSSETNRAGSVFPSEEMLALPERAVQFGTGALLRGLVEDLLDLSNRAGKFNGRVVAIGSTGSGRDDLINAQDGLFTLLTEGVENGKPSSSHRVVASLSRALAATGEWQEILSVARNPDIEVVFSNTTEVGLALHAEDAPDNGAPKSFPAKLTRFLLERARAFGYDKSKGVVVLPCELLENNGDILRGLVTQTAQKWKLDAEFLEWLQGSVSFGNTLVDRIVSGAPAAERSGEIESRLGFRDVLITVCEPFRMFAVEGDERIRGWIERVSTGDGLFATSDIRPYRERKVRILNGGHTAMVPAALLAGCETVYDAMQDLKIGAFIRGAILDEILPTLEVPDGARFADEVLERFANPYIAHALMDITLHGTAKMKVRVIPSIVAYCAREGEVPANLTFGFAAHLVFLRGEIQNARAAAHLTVPADTAGETIRAAWRSGADTVSLVNRICADAGLWGTDLTLLPEFARTVAKNVDSILESGVRSALMRAAAGRNAEALS
jgi:tagaturonate reductase